MGELLWGQQSRGGKIIGQTVRPGGITLSPSDADEEIRVQADATCDGSGDQEVINWALNKSEDVLLLPGTYRTTEESRQAKDYSHLRGCGVGVSIIKAVNAAGNFDILAGPASGTARFCSVSDLTLDGNRDYMASGVVIDMSRLFEFRMRHLQVLEGRGDAAKANTAGIYCDNTIAGVEGLRAYDVFVDETQNDFDAWHLRLTFVSLLACSGLHANGTGHAFWCRGNDWTVTNCWSDHGSEKTGYGFAAYYLENSAFTNCHVYRSSPVAWQQTGYCKNVGFDNCWADDCLGRAFVVQPANTIDDTIEGARIIHCGVRDLVLDDGHQESFDAIGDSAKILKDSIIAYNYFPYPITWGDITYTDCIRYPQVGQKLENQGKFTGSGNGSNTTYVFAHAVDQTPTWLSVTPGHADAGGDCHVTVDATNITVTYAVAPQAGTDNVVLYWRACKP